jgi:hypothetical protein
VKTYENQSGTSVAPYPTASDAVKLKRVRRLKGTRFMIAIPDTATAQKRKVVIPPSTEDGIETSAAENFANRPARMRNTVFVSLHVQDH